MKLRFLGTGTSFGIPVVGCSCERCTSSDRRDRRTRHAALLEADDGRRVLVDTPPELRLQLLDAGVTSIDAVWFTHEHADHVAGIDDLRIFSARSHRPIPAYASERCAHVLRQRFPYIFDPGYHPPEGTSKPELHLERLDPFVTADVGGLPMLPLPLPHGDVETFGFRVGGLGYLTDAQAVPEAVRRALDGVRVLVLSALWFGHPHPTHLNIEQAVEIAGAIGASQTYLVHLTHRVGHQALLDALPGGVEPAYDGLSVDIGS